ncbi:TyrR/PhhR family helix-turn-helix DNA-binding protein [Marinomonas sp. RS-M-Aa-14]|uniref:TyrR/PhhR family helix-turn-helix DNA-binding protein n=1 Tax=Marinomonas sp. RS-M-Aa-14 TaxID=3241169 RepID=UPI003AAC018A
MQQFIKGIHFSKDTWANPKEGISKRIRIRHKTLLLEMKPIFVSDDEGVANPAGTVIYVKSKVRLDRQAESLKQAPDAENPLESYFQPAVRKSPSMRQTLNQAKAFVDVPQPLLVQGETGTGKRSLIDALFQYWHKRHGERDASLIVRHARDLTKADIEAFDNLSGWIVIEEIEYLSESMQIEIMNWLTRQPSMRLVSVSSLSQAQLADGTRLNKALYFALATLVLSMPPLRERKEDIEGLVQQIVVAQSERHRQTVPSIAKNAIVKLALYDWPGNLKELQNICLQTLLTQKTLWLAEDIHVPQLNAFAEMALVNDSLEQTVKQWEAELLKRLYPNFPSTRRLAKAVGMSHSAIANKLKEYGIKT